MSKSLTETFSDDYVVCMECGERFQRITRDHLHFKHRMTFKEYLERHPGANLTSEATKAKLSEATKRHYEEHPEDRAKISEANRGENNPMKRPEARAKNSKSQKRSYEEHPERKIRLATRGENNPAKRLEVRAKLRESMMKRDNPMGDPEVRAKFCGENNPNWNDGASFKPYCRKFNERLKEIYRNRYSRTCVLCGKSELLNGGRRLSVHHIDGNKMQGCNVPDWHLVPLCASCNGKKPENDPFLVTLLLLTELSH